MLPNNYECEGQLNIWDYLSSASAEPQPKAEPDDSICEGCKWREHKDRELNVDEYGQTWVSKCPGTACMNWTEGTPLNLTCESEDMTMPEYEFQDRTEFPYCYNRDFLPSLEQVIKIIEDHFNIKFTENPCDWDDEIANVYSKKIKKGVFEVYESHYAKSVHNGDRHISVSFDEPMSGRARPCDNLYEVMNFFEKVFEYIEGKENGKKHHPTR